MKRYFDIPAVFLAAAALMLAVHSETAHAQTRHPTFFFKAGKSFPKSPERFDAFWDDGFTAEAGFGYPLNHRLELRGIAGYQWWQFAKRDFLSSAGVPSSPGVTLSGTNVYGLSAFLNLVTFFKTDYEQYSTYLLCGAGALSMLGEEMQVKLSGTRLDGIRSLESTSFAMNWGLGMDVYVTPGLTLSLETKYMAGFSGGGHPGLLFFHAGAAFPLR